MTDTVSHFNNPARYEYILYLPMAANFDDYFKPEVIDRYLIKAVAPFPVTAAMSQDLREFRDKVYFEFVSDISDKLSKFLKKHGESPSVKFYIEDSPFGSGIIKFVSSVKTAEIYCEKADELFADIAMTDDMVKRGAKWSNVKPEKVNHIVSYNHNVHKLH